MGPLSLDTPVEDLARAHPEAVGWAVVRGVSFLGCCDAAPGSLGDLLRRRGVADPEGFLEDLKGFLGRT